MEAPIPGTAVFDAFLSNPSVWHFSFHNVRDVPEMLVAGRERQYLQHIINERIFDPSAITDDDLELYASAYAAPGAMRAAFELYRAFARDAEDNRDALQQNGKLIVPVLAIGGATSGGPLVEQMMLEVAEDVTGMVVSGAAHWIPEETPGLFSAALLEFLAGADRKVVGGGQNTTMSPR